MNLRALIIGIDSNIGKALAVYLRSNGWNVLGTTRRLQHSDNNTFYVDLEHEHTIYNITYEFDAIYSCAAITNMDFCEQHPEISKRVNLDSQITLAQHCINKTKSYIFLSTAGVFDGSMPMRNTNDIPTPKCNYGYHKALTEQFLLGLSNNVTIVRTTKVLSADNKLINSWIDALSNNIYIEPFDDMTLAPVPIDMLVLLLTQIATNRSKPIVHISGKSDFLYSDLASLIAGRLGKPTSLIRSKSYLHAGLTSNTVFPYSSLDMSETTQHYGLQPLDIKNILDAILK